MSQDVWLALLFLREMHLVIRLDVNVAACTKQTKSTWPDVGILSGGGSLHLARTLIGPNWAWSRLRRILPSGRLTSLAGRQRLERTHELRFAMRKDCDNLFVHNRRKTGKWFAMTIMNPDLLPIRTTGIAVGPDGNPNNLLHSRVVRYHTGDWKMDNNAWHQTVDVNPLAKREWRRTETLCNVVTTQSLDCQYCLTYVALPR